MLGLSAAVLAIAGAVSTVLLLIGLPRTFGALDRLNTNSTLAAEQMADLVGGSLTALLLPTIVQGLATVVLTGILIVNVSEAVLGRRPTVSQVWSRTRARVPALVGLSLLVGLILVLIPVLLLTPGIVLLAAGATRSGAVTLVLAIPAAIAVDAWIYIRLAFTAPALLLERMSVGTAMRRSWLLTRASWWRVLGILLLTAIIAGIANSLLQAPFSILGQVLSVALDHGNATGISELTRSMTIPLVVGNVGGIVASTVTAPFTAAVTALLYIDLRMRREGLDVALARAAAQQP